MSRSTLTVGNHAVTAAFTSEHPDTLNSCGALSGGQTVQNADTQTGVTSSLNPSELGVPSRSPRRSHGGARRGVPSGSVQFNDNGTDLGLPRASTAPATPR